MTTPCDHVHDGEYCTNTDTETYELGSDGRHYDLCPEHAPANEDPIEEAEFA